MPADVEAAQYRTTIRDRIIYLAEDFEREIRPETPGIRDLYQSEVAPSPALARPNRTRVAIRIFLIIGLFLVAAMVGIATYTHR